MHKFSGAMAGFGYRCLHLLHTLMLPTTKLSSNALTGVNNHNEQVVEVLEVDAWLILAHVLPQLL